ncbi:MAG TPA: PLP-dependent aminotransferase family protein [Myxococcaceae bacterium]|nr:PLP-dependent aminotransferase family protein [Myxococcaceae bacterium]
MAEWVPSLFLDPRSEDPVYLQIAHALMREIHRGRFRPGDPLPGYRTLAEQLGVSRNTVMSAYHELQVEGWVVSAPGEGSAVARRLPAHLPARLQSRNEVPRAASGTIGFALGPEPAPPTAGGQRGMLEVASGVPDPRLLPGAALARAYRRAILRARGGPESGDPQGQLQLREALSRMLSSTRAISAPPERIFVARGSQMALYLVAQAVVSPGDTVAVEALGARRAWDAFVRAGARCLPVSIDDEGLQIQALEALLRETPVRAVFVTPQRQYPTLAVLSAERRARLLQLAATHRFAVIEMDPDSEFHFEGRPQAPLASKDPSQVVVHVGTLSKIFSPDLRLGFVVGPVPLLTRMNALRATYDRHGDPVLERAMAELMEDGELQRHLNRMDKVYRSRRDALCAGLGETLGETLAVVPPGGGLAIWARVQREVDVDAWAARALERGVSFQPGRRFSFDGSAVPGLRLGFSNYPEPELQEVARRLRSALEDLR